MQGRWWCYEEGCTKNFKHEKDLRWHLRAHEMVRRGETKCPIAGCNAVFSRPWVLQRHVDEQHPPSGEEPGGRRKAKRSSSQAVDRDPDDEGVEGGRYKCDRPGCKGAFDTKDKLRKHVRNHEVVNEGRTICSTCKKSFSSRSVKRRHQATARHAQTPSPPREPKQFQCPLCDRSYDRQNTLNDHLKSHEGKADCPYCPKSYRRPEGMHEHVRKQHPDKPDPRDKHNPN
nr:PREDICTED: serendipity locus protein delta-like [Bemisia tabaci]